MKLNFALLLIVLLTVPQQAQAFAWTFLNTIICWIPLVRWLFCNDCLFLGDDACNVVGECTNKLFGNYTCNCNDTGFEGDTCEVDIDDCALGDPWYVRFKTFTRGSRFFYRRLYRVLTLHSASFVSPFFDQQRWKLHRYVLYWVLFILHDYFLYPFLTDLLSLDLSRLSFDLEDLPGLLNVTCECPENTTDVCLPLP